MSSECIMCGKATTGAILCPACDRPRKSEPRTPPAQKGASPAAQAAIEAFPEAPIVQFPVESTSPAVTAVREILTAARVPSLLLGGDGRVRYIAAEARTLLGLEDENVPLNAAMIESRLGCKLPDPHEVHSRAIELGDRPVVLSAIPIGAGGVALVLRPKGGSMAATAYMSFVRETILTPLLGLREALLAAARNRGNDPMFRDAASTIDQVLSSLELAPEIEDSDSAYSGVHTRPSIASVVESLTQRFAPLAEAKKIQLQVDFAGQKVAFRDLSDLEDVLGILIENSLHYVPAGGQIVVGLRRMDHKGKPLLLFFVMDNGPIVPPELREQIFAKDFVWKPHSPHRTGRGLQRCRQFAAAHGGSIWVEAKTGKACTFFLRVRPTD